MFGPRIKAVFFQTNITRLTKRKSYFISSNLVSLQVKYKANYEKNKGKVIGIKSVSDDSQMAHSALATRLQSGRNYKKDYEDTKANYR